MSDELKHGNFSVKWSGWYRAPWQDVYLGQWLASDGYNKLYASYPGGEGRLGDYDQMEVSVYPGQHHLGSFSHNCEFDGAKEQCLNRLLELLPQIKQG